MRISAEKDSYECVFSSLVPEASRNIKRARSGELDPGNTGAAPIGMVIAELS